MTVQTQSEMVYRAAVNRWLLLNATVEAASTLLAGMKKVPVSSRGQELDLAMVQDVFDRLELEAFRKRRRS